MGYFMLGYKSATQGQKICPVVLKPPEGAGKSSKATVKILKNLQIHILPMIRSHAWPGHSLQKYQNKPKKLDCNTFHCPYQESNSLVLQIINFIKGKVAFFRHL